MIANQAPERPSSQQQQRPLQGYWLLQFAPLSVGGGSAALSSRVSAGVETLMGATHHHQQRRRRRPRSKVSLSRGPANAVANRAQVGASAYLHQVATKRVVGGKGDVVAATKSPPS